MKTAQQQTEIKEHLSGYELTHKTIKNLAQYDLTPTAKLVLVLLTTHYNEGKNGAVVFPSMPTISDTLGIGLTATKKAIKDLIEAGAIIKAKRDKVRGNCNKYALTKKVLNPNFKQSKSELFKRSENDLFMLTSNHKLSNQSTTGAPEKIEAPKKNEIVIDFSLKSQKKHNRVTLADVADSVKSNPKIKNPCAYWASLNEEERKAIFDREKAEREKTARAEKLKQEEEAHRERERAEEEAYNALPVQERYTKERAVRTLYATRFYYLKRRQLNAFTREFVDYYALNADLICSMTAEQLEAYITENC